MLIQAVQISSYSRHNLTSSLLVCTHWLLVLNTNSKSVPQTSMGMVSSQNWRHWFQTQSQPWWTQSLQACFTLQSHLCGRSHSTMEEPLLATNLKFTPVMIKHTSKMLKCVMHHHKSRWSHFHVMLRWQLWSSSMDMCEGKWLLPKWEPKTRLDGATFRRKTVLVLLHKLSQLSWTHLWLMKVRSQTSRSKFTGTQLCLKSTLAHNLSLRTAWNGTRPLIIG